MLRTGGIERLGQDHNIYSEFRAQQARCKTDVAALALLLQPPSMPPSAGKWWQAGHTEVSSRSLHLSAHGENIKDMSAPPDALVRVPLTECPSCPIPEFLLKAANKAPEVSSWM